MTTKIKIKELNERIKVLKSEMLEESKKLFKEVSAEIFTKFPEVESFAWHQYTPYFNDGDTCEFSVHCDDYSIVINEIGEADDDFDSFEKEREEISDFLSQINEEAMEEMFGDHVEIVVDRKGVEVNDYDHD